MKNQIYDGDKPFNYDRIARLWSIILDKDVEAKQVALCLHQLHLSGLLDNPDDLEYIIPMTENLFKYEALNRL